MTKVVGLTGGIGSGKTTVALQFAKFGVPVYIADTAAKDILQEKQVMAEIADEFGSDVIIDGIVSNKLLGGIVFDNPLKLQRLNQIIHPRVFAHFRNWLESQQHFRYVIKEAAILFESGSYRQCDKVITVSAPVEIRIQRVMARDHVDRASVEKRIGNQWTDEMRNALSDYIIDNTDIESTHAQISKIHAELLIV